MDRSVQNTLSRQPIPTEAFHDAAAAVVRLTEIYERNTEFLRRHFAAYLKGKRPARRVRACYPFVRITTGTFARVDSRLSYGFVSGPGVHETTVTRPDLFRRYFTEQIGLLLDNHGVPVEIGESHEPIPVHFAYRRDIGSEAGFLDAPPDRPLRDFFDTPDLAAMDDAIVDGTAQCGDISQWMPRPQRAGVEDGSKYINRGNPDAAPLGVVVQWPNPAVDPDGNMWRFHPNPAPSGGER